MYGLLWAVLPQFCPRRRGIRVLGGSSLPAAKYVFRFSLEGSDPPGGIRSASP